MNTLHHCSRLYEVVRTLKAWLPTIFEGRRLGTWSKHIWLWRLHGKLITSTKQGIRLSEWTSLVVDFYVLLQVLCIFSFACHLLAREKRLCRVLEVIHEALSLEMWVKAHRRSYLSVLLSWSHLPVGPFRVRWHAVNVCLLRNCLFYSITIATVSAEVHPWRPNELAGVTLLFKPFPVVISLINWLDCHLEASN